MKYFLAFLLLLSFFHLGRAAAALDLITGFIVGLKLGNISSKLQECAIDVDINIKTIQHAIDELKKPHTFYEKGDILTKAVLLIPEMSRTCTSAPIDFWINFKEKFLKKFNYDLVKYIHGLFLNLGKSKDEILYNLLQIKEHFQNQEYYKTGYHLGTLTNIILNVTEVPPSMYDDFPVLEDQLAIDWDIWHKQFLKLFDYLMTSVNYTKWVDPKDVEEFNGVVLAIELNLYNALKKLSEKDILEGILTIIDNLKYANTAFKATYTTVMQVVAGVYKDSIFEHKEYALKNLLVHSGYFVWDGYKLVKACMAGDLKEGIRRVIIILRKALYFDEDGINDMLD